MSTFKVGDRVAAYEFGVRHPGEVKAIEESGELVVLRDGFLNEFKIHPKQCRRLVRRTTRRVWITVADIRRLDRTRADAEQLVVWKDPIIDMTHESVEFIEVPRK
jgi:hypothetical protein